MLSPKRNNTHLVLAPKTDVARANIVAEMPLNAPLLQTSTAPRWVHPLAWSLDHLTMLRISIQLVPEVTSSHEPDAGLAPGESRLSVGFISSRELQFVHHLHRANILDSYLATFIVKTVDSFQRELKSKPFRYKSAE